MIQSHTTMKLRRICDGVTPAVVPARLRVGVAVATMIASLSLARAASADPYFFSTGTPDGLLGTLSQPVGKGNLETETADDFILTETTTIAQATIEGLVPTGTALTDIDNVEVEFYHVFPNDSVVLPVVRVPSRANSPADVEIGSATRDGERGTLSFRAEVLNASFQALNSVSDGVNPAPANLTHGDGAARGEEVRITITFTPPVVLPADHYFFRPEVEVAAGQFLFLSTPKPLVPPGTPFVGDLQAWIRNSALKPDWLRIGTDIIGDVPLRTFNMAVSLAGDTVPEAGLPGTANCHGRSVLALTEQFGSLEAAARAMGFSSVKALQQTFKGFCEQGRSRTLR
ncbi:MAG TPA: hypothetical protein VN634_20790 [Candidatus Limnocylindrales bacterium]|nr:hypothetical protein [Candidatus Limnocylindrales bacterium]